VYASSFIDSGNWVFLISFFFFHEGVSGFYSTAHIFDDFVHIPSS